MNYNAVRLRGYNLIIIKPKSLNYFLFGIILGRGCKYREFWYRVNFHIDWLKSAPVFSAGSDDDDEGPILYFPQRILSLTVTLGPGHNLSVCWPRRYFPVLKNVDCKMLNINEKNVDCKMFIINNKYSGFLRPREMSMSPCVLLS